WLRANLFNGIGNTILTIVALAAIWYAGSALLRWVFTKATSTPTRVNRKILAVDIYPWERIWGPGTALAIVSLLLGISAGKWGGFMRSLGIGVLTVLTVWALMPVDPTARTILGLGGGLIVLGYFVGRMVRISGAVI